MPLTIDPALEARVQREIDRGAYGEPSEVIAHALDLMEAEREFLSSQTATGNMDTWLMQNRKAIDEALERSMAQAARGETLSGEEAMRMLTERQAARSA